MSVNLSRSGTDASLSGTCKDIVRVHRCAEPLSSSLHIGWKAPLRSAINALPNGIPDLLGPNTRIANGSKLCVGTFQAGGYTNKRRSSASCQLRAMFAGRLGVS